MDLSLNANSYNKGIVAYNNRQYEKTIEFMSYAIEENSWIEFSLAYKIRALAYANINEYQKSLIDINIAEKTIKNDSLIYFTRGQLNHTLKNLNEAIEDYYSCINLDINHIKALTNLSRLLIETEQNTKALEILNSLININPTYDLYLKKGRVLNKLNDKIGALVSYSKAININPNDFQGYQGFAFIVYNSKEYDVAIKHFTKCIELMPFETFYYYRGKSKKEIGDIGGYIQDINKSNELGDKNAAIEIKNNHELFLKKNYILFFDTETTGIPRNWKAPVSDINNWPRLVQLAWQLYDEEGNLIESKGTIIKPSNFIIPEESTKIHRISTERAYLEGESLKDVLLEFKDKLMRSKLLIAHNMSFDEKVLGCEFHRLFKENPLSNMTKFCTMERTTNICKLPSSYGYKWPKLQELYYFLFETDIEEAHNAEIDIQATAKCYWELKVRKLI